MFTKTLILSFALVAPHTNQAQSRPYSRAKSSVAKPKKKVILVQNNNVVLKLSIGDTCYITTANVPVRTQPTISSSAATYLRQNAKVTIREIVGTKWVLIDYYEQDVGVVGYVSQQCISRKKIK